jgi:hypothetical protein
MVTSKSILFFTAFFLYSLFSTAQTITLRDTTNQFDYIIITVPEFVSACEPFKLHKETVRDFRTLIVDTSQIFAEFDSSSAPEDNIRNFISYAGTFWREPRPVYFLLVGNVQAVPNFTIQPPHPSLSESYSDYYYRYSIYDIDTTTTDFYLGRIPALNENEVTNYFSKVIEYESINNLEPWMNNNLFVCLEDSFFGFLNNAIYISENILPEFTYSTIISHLEGSPYYGNKDSILNEVNETGFSVVWFQGLNSDSFFISPDYFNINDVNGFNNDPKYFLSIFMYPQNSIIDTNTNLTREMLLLQAAGSLGGSVITGITFWALIKTYHQYLALRLFNPDFVTLGEVYENIPLGPSGYHLLRLANLWADPSLVLKYDPTVNVEEIQNDLPSDFTLFQNYPNPFNPKTKIEFRIVNSGFVSLKVFNVLGKEVAILVNDYKPAGKFEVEFNASELTSGVYFYQLKVENIIETKKMILLK